MSHNRISRALVLAIAATLIVAPASHAQIGGFLKKKAQEAAQAKVEQQNKATDPKDVAMSESDLSALFRGLDAELPKAEKARNLSRRADSLDKAADALSQSHQVEYGVYEKRRSAVADCRSSEFSRLNDAHSTEMQKHQGDPMMMARIQQVAMAHVTATNKAMQAGDTVALAKENEDYMKKIMAIAGVEPKADSAAVDKKCGPLPKEPAWIGQSEKMKKDAEEARTQYKMADSDIISTGAAASGMNIEQYGQARERLIAWYHSTNGGKNKGNDSADGRLFSAHIAQIQKYKASLSAEQ